MMSAAPGTPNATLNQKERIESIQKGLNRDNYAFVRKEILLNLNLDLT